MKLSSLTRVTLTASLVALYGCGGGERKEPETSLVDLSVEQPVVGGTLVVGLAGDFDSLNELVSNDANALHVIESMLFMTLTRYDRSLKVRPHLAERWEFSPDRRIITYYLRPDVSWHDGVRTTARDVVFTLRAMKDPRTKYANQDYMANVDSVVAVDDLTVRVYFKRAYATQLEDCQRPILPAHLLEDLPLDDLERSGFGRNPVGNGPFRFVRWEEGRKIEFVANEGYCLGRPYLDRVVFTIIPGTKARLAALRTGEVDYVEGVPPAEVEAIRSWETMQVFEVSQRGYQFVAWNARVSLFRDPRVRRALTLAIDRKGMVDELLYGQGHVLANPLMSASWSYNRNILPYPHDPVRARALLAEAGWRDRDGDGLLDRGGRPFRFVLKTNQGSALREDAARMVIEDLRRVGIEASLETIEWVAFVKDITRKEFEAVLLGWQDDFTWHPADQFHSANLDGEFQLTGYSNPLADDLMDEARWAVDKGEVARLYGRLQEVLHKDQPYTVLYERTNYNVLHRRFRGVMMDSRSQFVNIAKWWIPPEARHDEAGLASR